MYIFSKQLQKFHDEHIKLSNDQQNAMRNRRAVNQIRLRTGLTKAGAIEPLEFIKMGSYAMKTMIQVPDNKYHFDDGVVFEQDKLVGEDGNALTALQARKMVRNALLDDKFDTEPDLQKNCICAKYNEGYHVNIPVYRQVKKTDILGNVITSLEHAGSEWQKSAPLNVTSWFNEANNNLSPPNDPEQFRNIVRLIKMYTRNTTDLSNRKRLSGLIISALVNECYKADEGRLDRALYSTMVSIKERLKNNLEISHPALQDKMLTNSVADHEIVLLKEQLEVQIQNMAGIFSDVVSYQDFSGIYNDVLKHKAIEPVQTEKIHLETLS